MTTKCLSCGYLHDDIQLNCPKCGSFYTEIIVEEAEPSAEDSNAEKKTSRVIDNLKHKLENLIHPHGANND